MEAVQAETLSAVANGHGTVPKEIVVNVPKAAEAKPQEDAPKRSFAEVIVGLRCV